MFCDVIEGVYNTNKTNPGSKGIGLKKALKNYVKYVKLTVTRKFPPPNQPTTTSS